MKQAEVYKSKLAWCGCPLCCLICRRRVRKKLRVSWAFRIAISMQVKLLLMSDQGSPLSFPLYLPVLIEAGTVVAYVVAHTPTLHSTVFSTGSVRHIGHLWFDKVAGLYMVDGNASCSAMPMAHVRPCQWLMFGS